jgi:hypothetical protein
MYHEHKFYLCDHCEIPDRIAGAIHLCGMKECNRNAQLIYGERFSGLFQLTEREIRERLDARER